MMEKIRIVIMQYTTAGMALILTILFCYKVIIKADLIAKFYNFQIDFIFITLTAGLFFIGLLAFKFSVWIMKEPRVETNKEKFQGQKIEAIKG